ncbi:MAG: hypothetical protein H8E44_21885 [Planctomycetes bacterium]|nr:hypothetical protein [Planctomycetota bacterium]
MVGKLVAFWVLWFIVTLVIGKVWPGTVNGTGRRVIPVSFGNGILGFIVTVILVVIIQALTGAVVGLD